jgi:hypothetical protein
MINVNGTPNMNNNNVPIININGGGGGGVPMINVDPPIIHIDSDNRSSPRKQVFEIPGVSVSGLEFDDHHGGPTFNVSGPEDHSHSAPHLGHGRQQQPQRPSSQSQYAPPRTGGLICGGCHGAIIGRIVSAMGQRFHPSCFKCTVCNELLEHVSSYEHEGRPYCHLDYHEVRIFDLFLFYFQNTMPVHRVFFPCLLNGCFSLFRTLHRDVIVAKLQSLRNNSSA